MSCALLYSKCSKDVFNAAQIRAEPCLPRIQVPLGTIEICKLASTIAAMLAMYWIIVIQYSHVFNMKE